MVISDFDVTPCTMRKEDPTWRFALGASPVTDGHVLRLATEADRAFESDRGNGDTTGEDALTMSTARERALVSVPLE